MLAITNSGRLIAVCLSGLASIAPTAAAEDFLRGVWVGSYVCYQGPTALTLVIEPDGAQWAGIFSFGPDKANKDVPKGSYALIITESNGEIEFRPDGWIEQPDGYVPVALHGSLSDDLTTLSGDVDFDGCESFETTRMTPMPPAAGKTK